MAVAASLARPEEGALGNVAHRAGLLLVVPEELVELGLNAFAHAAEQDCHQGWQGKFTLTREGMDVISKDQKDLYWRLSGTQKMPRMQGVGRTQQSHPVENKSAISKVDP